MVKEIRVVHSKLCTYNDHPWDPKIVVGVVRWSLYRGHLSNKSFKWDLGGRIIYLIAKRL